MLDEGSRKREKDYDLRQGKKVGGLFLLSNYRDLFIRNQFMVYFVQKMTVQRMN